MDSRNMVKNFKRKIGAIAINYIKEGSESGRRKLVDRVGLDFVTIRIAGADCCPGMGKKVQGD